MTNAEWPIHQSSSRHGNDPTITSELIDYYRRRAHRMRSEAQRQAICSTLRILRGMLRCLAHSVGVSGVSASGCLKPNIGDATDEGLYVVHEDGARIGGLSKALD